MVQHEFSRLAIAGRGEPAMRVVNAVRELNHGRAGPVRLVALHTEAERDALFVRHADEAVCLDPGPVGLERALRAAGADAAWGGLGAASAWASCSSAPIRRR
jgi:biotin carboxylase